VATKILCQTKVQRLVAGLAASGLELLILRLALGQELALGVFP